MKDTWENVTWIHWPVPDDEGGSFMFIHGTQYHFELVNWSTDFMVLSFIAIWTTIADLKLL